MTGMADAAPRSPEAWKSMGCCVDFPQPWADLMWGLEFEDTCVLSSCYRPVWREFSFRKSGGF